MSWAKAYGMGASALGFLGRSEEARLLLSGVPLEDRVLGSFVHVMLPAVQGEVEEARANMEQTLAQGSAIPAMVLAVAPATGDRALVHRLAAEADARPAGPFLLLFAVHNCRCGAPFDLEATPNLRARLSESGLSWPPPTVLHFPLKDW